MIIFDFIFFKICKFCFFLIKQVDLADEQRQIATEEAVSWCKNNGNLPYLETSAKDSTNVENAFVTAVNIWSSLEEKLEKMYDGDAVTLSQNYESPKSVSCCSSNKS